MAEQECLPLGGPEFRVATGAQRAVHGIFVHGVTSTLSLPWTSWKHLPEAGDLLFVVSTRVLMGASPDWIISSAQTAYCRYHPAEPDPVFASEEDGTEWAVAGYIVYPPAGPSGVTIAQPWQA